MLRFIRKQASTIRSLPTLAQSIKTATTSLNKKTTYQKMQRFTQSKEFKTAKPYVLLGIGSAALLTNYMKPPLAQRLKNKSVSEKLIYLEKLPQSELHQSLPTLEDLIEAVKLWPRMDFNIRLLQKLGSDFINDKIQNEQDLGKLAQALYDHEDKSTLMKMIGRDKIMQILENPNALRFLINTEHGFWHDKEITILFSMITDDDLRKIIHNYDQLSIIYYFVPLTYLNQRLGQSHIRNILRDIPDKPLSTSPSLKDTARGI